ncbi:MAG: LysR family transcriptional regulator [Phycisphaerae bacterium]|nr:LysR family transcriptional regulator [Phycisphaerae bacterium]
MNINVMKTFCDLVDTGSFSRAAESNYVSQSAVSQQLAKLEGDLSVQLITRGGGGLVVPTDSGKAFYDGAREIVRRYEQLLGEVKSVTDSVRGVLRVGTIYSIGFYLLDPFVRKFFQEHPDVNLHVSYTGWNRIVASIISGEMDLGVVACPEKNRSLEIIPLVDEQLVVVCSPSHRLAGKKTVTNEDLEGAGFVAFEANIPTRQHIDKLLKKAHINVEIKMEFDNIELLKRAIMVGDGLSILPLDNIVQETQRGDLCFMKFSDPKNWVRPVGACRRRGRQPSPAEKMFLELLNPKK